MSSHLDPDQLADLQEGLLEASAAATATAHLAGCANCSAEAAALRAVTQQLVAAGDVGPMPADIAERLDIAIAEAQDDSTATAKNVIPLSSRRSTWSTRKWLQVAAGLVLIVTGSAIVLPTLTGVADRSANETAAKSTSEDAGTDDKVTGTNSTLMAIETGANYTEKTLPGEVSRRLTAPQAYEAAGAPSSRQGPQSPIAASGSSDANRLADPEALAGCVAALTPDSPGGDVVLVDVAKFNGKAATIIVLELPDQPSLLGAWVVGPRCRRENAETLHFQSVPRP